MIPARPAATTMNIRIGKYSRKSSFIHSPETGQFRRAPLTTHLPIQAALAEPHKKARLSPNRTRGHYSARCRTAKAQKCRACGENVFIFGGLDNTAASREPAS